MLALSEASTDIVLAGEEARSPWAKRKLWLPVRGVWALVDQLCLYAMTGGSEGRERCIVAGKRNRDGEREREHSTRSAVGMRRAVSVSGWMGRTYMYYLVGPHRYLGLTNPRDKNPYNFYQSTL